MKTRVLSYVFLAISIGLGYYLYWSIKEPMEEKQRIEKAEKLVIQKLELIREAQKAYIKRNGTYADKWEKLIAFVDTGVIYNIQIKEEILPPDPTQPWLGEQVKFIEDTLETIPAKSYILGELKKNIPNNPTKDFESKNLPFKIGIKEKFELYTAKIPMGGTNVDVIEVKDANPIDKTRREDHDLINRRPIRFGSRDDVSTSGSWQ